MGTNTEDELREFLEENLPYDDLELFLEDNDISSFVVEFAKENDKQLMITYVCVNE